jgi:hypothetical protein
VDLLVEDIRSGPLINMDETPLQVLKEPGKKNIAGITGLAASGYLLASPVRGFHAVNVSMLFVMLLLVADRLVTSGIIT